VSTDLKGAIVVTTQTEAENNEFKNLPQRTDLYKFKVMNRQTGKLIGEIPVQIVEVNDPYRP